MTTISRSSLSGLALIASCGPGTPPSSTETDGPPETSSSEPTGANLTTSIDQVPPKLLSVLLRDASTLELTFTEPLSNVLEVDPSVFKVSAGFHIVSAPATGTQYFDPSRWNCFYDSKPCGGENPCYDVCYPIEEKSLDVIGIMPVVDDPTRVLLVLENPILFLTCWTIKYKASMSEIKDGGLFLHYVNKGTKNLVDVNGNELASFGESWVEAGLDYLLVEDQVFPELDPFLPIPCTSKP